MQHPGLPTQEEESQHFKAMCPLMSHVVNRRVSVGVANGSMGEGLYIRSRNDSRAAVSQQSPPPPWVTTRES